MEASDEAGLGGLPALDFAASIRMAVRCCGRGFPYPSTLTIGRGRCCRSTRVPGSPRFYVQAPWNKNHERRSELAGCLVLWASWVWGRERLSGFPQVGWVKPVPSRSLEEHRRPRTGR